MHGLVRYSVLFVIDLKTRCVHLAGIAHDPYGAWMDQIARNLTDAVDGFLKNTRYLIHDRDPLFTAPSALPRCARAVVPPGLRPAKLDFIHSGSRRHSPRSFESAASRL